MENNNAVTVRKSNNNKLSMLSSIQVHRNIINKTIARDKQVIAILTTMDIGSIMEGKLLAVKKTGVNLFKVTPKLPLPENKFPTKFTIPMEMVIKYIDAIKLYNNID